MDRRSGLLRRECVRVVDTRGPGDSAQLTLSNFAAREDRETGELVIHLSRLFQHSPADGLEWTSDASLSRVPVP